MQQREDEQTQRHQEKTGLELQIKEDDLIQDSGGRTGETENERAG